MRVVKSIAVMGLIVALLSGFAGGSRPEKVEVAPWNGAVVRSVCVEGVGSFHDQPRDKVAVRTLKNVLKAPGPSARLDGSALRTYPVKIVKGGGAACDAVLRLEFSGRALAGQYNLVATTYTGYEVTGQVTLAAADQPTLAYPLTLHQEPPESVSGTFDQLEKYDDPMYVFQQVGFALHTETSKALLQWFGQGVKV